VSTSTLQGSTTPIPKEGLVAAGVKPSGQSIVLQPAGAQAMLVLDHDLKQHKARGTVMFEGPGPLPTSSKGVPSAASFMVTWWMKNPELPHGETLFFSIWDSRGE